MSARWIKTNCLLLVGLLSFIGDPTGLSVGADEHAMTRVVRAAASRVLDSIVTIEVIGALGGEGEIRQDAPTAGVVVDEEGHVITSSQVTASASATIIVIDGDGARYPAQVVGEDVVRGIVMLKLGGSNDFPPAITWRADSSEAANFPQRQIGQTMVAVSRYGAKGSPMVSVGILSAMGRLKGDALQTDARVSPSFYGGPLLDIEGNVHGILIPSAGDAAAGGGQDPTQWYDSGIAFATSIEAIVKRLGALRAGNKIRAGLLGIVPAERDSSSTNTTVAAVRPRSPAEQAGIRAGDQITRINEQPVRRIDDMRLALGRCDAGDEIRIAFQRGEEEFSATVELVDAIAPPRAQLLGAFVREDIKPGKQNGEASIDEKDPQRGVVDRSLQIESLLQDGPADGSLRVGDRLLRINGTEVSSLSTLRRQLWLAEADEELVLTIIRESEEVVQNVTPRDLAGSLRDVYGAALDQTESRQAKTQGWKTTTLRLPEIENAAAVYGPVIDEAKEARRAADANAAGGLLVILLEPDHREAKESLKAFIDAAKRTGVAVCVIASQQEGRWQPAEDAAIVRLTTAAARQCRVTSAATAIVSENVCRLGGVPGPSDTMAMGVALSREDTYAGLSVVPNLQPPAVRLSPADPIRMIRILVPIAAEDDRPSWGQVLGRFGCVIQESPSVDAGLLMRWLTRLPAI
ncbi:MAG: PDZ domain-containing protein [Planctomycetota bacterium]